MSDKGELDWGEHSQNFSWKKKTLLLPFSAIANGVRQSFYIGNLLSNNPGLMSDSLQYRRNHAKVSQDKERLPPSGFFGSTSY